jgi:hypothetical protein
MNNNTQHDDAKLLAVIRAARALLERLDATEVCYVPLERTELHKALAELDKLP